MSDQRSSAELSTVQLSSDQRRSAQISSAQLIRVSLQTHFQLFQSGPAGWQRLLASYISDATAASLGSHTVRNSNAQALTHLGTVTVMTLVTKHLPTLQYGAAVAESREAQ